MRALVITSSFPRGSGDVSGRFIGEWCQHLERLGHEFDVLTWSSSDEGQHDGESFGGIDVERVRYAPRDFERLFYGAGVPENVERQPWLLALTVPAVAAMLRRGLARVEEGDYDAVVGHWLVPGGLVARVIGAASDLPSVVVGHSGGVHTLASLPGPIAEPLIEFLAEGVMTVSAQTLADKLRGIASSIDPIVIPMGFEPFEVSRPRDQRRDWLFMGRLVEIKGVDLAIEAFGRAELPEEVTLHIAGDGPLRDELQDLAQTIGASVEFHGFITGDAKRDVLARSGFGLFPSRKLGSGRTEGMPVSVLEATSAGVLPIVAGMPELRRFLSDEQLQYVSTVAVDDLASRIERLARFPSPRLEDMSDESVRRVSSLAWPRLAMRWDGILRKALQPN